MTTPVERDYARSPRPIRGRKSTVPTPDDLVTLITTDDTAMAIFLLGMEKGILEGLDQADKWRDDLYKAAVTSIVRGKGYSKLVTLTQICDGTKTTPYANTNQ